MAASRRRRRCLAGVTASSGWPCEFDERALTSHTTSVLQPGGFRRVQRMSISPWTQRQFRARTVYPWFAYQEAAASSAMCPRIIRRVLTPENGRPPGSEFLFG